MDKPDASVVGPYVACVTGPYGGTMTVVGETAEDAVAALSAVFKRAKRTDRWRAIRALFDYATKD